MKFTYIALKEGKRLKGSILAESEAKVVDYLRGQEYTVIEVTKRGQLPAIFGFLGRVTFSDIVNMTRQLAIMLNAGLTLVEAIDILKKQITKRDFSKMINQIYDDIRAGKSFSSSLSNFKDTFSGLYISLVRAGEASGKLDEILKGLADNLENQRAFQGKIKAALIYPAILISVMVIIFFFIMTFVIPNLLVFYKDLDVDLPVATKLMIAVSGFFQKFWPMVILFVGLFVFLLRKFIKSKRGKTLIDTLVLKIPKLSNVIKSAALVDTTRTLGILVQAGVSILESLEIIAGTSTNLVYRQAFEEIRSKIEKGQSLGRSMEEANIFPPILVQMATVGEETGHLDETLLRLSNYFEVESDLATKAIVTLIEPAIIIILAVGVLFIVLAVVGPIFTLTSSIK